MARYLLFILLFMVTSCCYAQEVSLKDTVAAYNTKRIKVNKTGMQILGAWGIVNIADGGIGYFTAKQDEWKYFHKMNAVWGVVNTGIAALGLVNGRREQAEKINAMTAYERYKASKKIYLINSGLDVLYMATGLGLTRYAETTKQNAAIFNGFGKSIVMQGAFLFIFDNFMYTTHARYNSKWIRVMDELSVSTNGIGIRHTIK